MIDKIREITVRKFENLCRRLKIPIPNHRTEVFMANTIEILDNLEKRISDLEEKLEK